MYLLDTNIFVRAIGGYEPEASFLTKTIRQNKLYISVIATTEFLSKAQEHEEEIFNELLDGFPILLVDLETARIAAQYRKQLLLKKKKVIVIDCLLAAQAKIHHLTLVTNNRADFPMKDIKIISP